MKPYILKIIIITLAIVLFGYVLLYTDSNLTLHITNKDNDIQYLTNKIDELNATIRFKDSLFIDHLSKCYMIDKSMIEYDKNGYLKLKTMKKLTFEGE